MSPQRTNRGRTVGAKMAALLLCALGGLLVAASPAPAKAVLIAEAENFSHNATGAPRLADGRASGGYTLALYRPSQAWSTLAPGSAVDTVIVRAKATRCDGSPRAAISIDGNLVATAKVSSILYKNYEVDAQMAPGAHTISIAFENDFAGAGCDRSLYVDKVTLTDANASSGVTLRPVDGGAGYYGQFSNALPTADTYFPIAVWGSYNHTTQNRDLDAAAGINTYVWAADNTFVDDIRADGRFKVIQDEGNRANIGSETAGWLLADEIDMTEGPGACPSRLDSITAGLPADGRLRYANYGKGVAIWQTDAQAQCFVNATDVVSDDMYWHTDPNERGRPQSGTSSGYGWTVDRLRALDAMDGKRQPIWNFVEVGWPWSEDQNAFGGSITPAEVRGAVWHSIIAGARGILYFQHQFSGPCAGDHHLTRSNCAGTRPMVTSVDAQIRSLAPVLNAPFADGLVSTAAQVRPMAKYHGGKFYVFAGNKTNAARPATFQMPCVGDATATVVGEGRSIPISGGQFSDNFADGNAIHIYRIDGGSTCGLPPS